MDELPKGADIDEILNTLPPREAEITRLYFGVGYDQPMTLEEIGQRFGLTRERVRQVKEKSLRKIQRRRNQIVHGVIEPHSEPASKITLIFDPETTDKDVVIEILSSLSDLYRSIGGDGLVISGGAALKEEGLFELQ